jgi:hypothetical protein
LIVIVEGGCVADKEIIGDLREIHAGNLIIRKSFAIHARPTVNGQAPPGRGLRKAEAPLGLAKGA